MTETGKKASQGTSRTKEGAFSVSTVNQGERRFENWSLEYSIPGLLSHSTVNSDCWRVLPHGGDRCNVSL